MNYAYILGKLILVISIVFLGYNELIDTDHVTTFKKNMLRLSKIIP